ncbi:hypothetical protein [Sorangium sp. So ce887]|uniref:hypothetical protein n=1 Tax=Sorangium sp. So ce887 TaxID=3133324 RepID=UPI003F5E38BD
MALLVQWVWKDNLEPFDRITSRSGLSGAGSRPRADEPAVRTLHGRALSAGLERLARSGAGEPVDARRMCHEERGLWWVLAQVFSPILRRAERKYADRG